MPPWAAHNYSDTAAKARKFAGRSLFTLGSGLCTAGVAVAKAAAAGIQTLTSDHSDREKVTFARVAELTWSDPVTGSERRLPVALLGYATGFQLWSLEDRDGPAELVSTRRDGAVRWVDRLQSGYAPAGFSAAWACALGTVLPKSGPSPPAFLCLLPDTQVAGASAGASQRGSNRRAPP